MAEPPPPVIEELTQACLEYVSRAVGVDLDFTPETLSILDHYATGARSEAEKNPALGETIARATGAYFGELVRSHFDGFWRLSSPSVHDWSVCLRTAFLTLNPLGVGYDAVFGGEAHDGPRSNLRVAEDDRKYLDHRLETLPPVPEDEYFLFTTRFEVLEVAVEALRARLEEQGYGETTFDVDDYGG